MIIISPQKRLRYHYKDDKDMCQDFNGGGPAFSGNT
jgi:hypothetical protein